MSEAPTDAEEPDEDPGTTIPEPPRRVPFGVAVTASLLGFVALLLAIGALLTLTTNSYYQDSVGQAAAEGLGTAGLAVGAAVVAAVAWSLVRNGNTVGPMVVGGLILLTGLIFLITGVASDSDTDGLRIGVLALAVGLGVLLVPLLGHGPSYLAARRVWARAERDWLHELATPDAPPPVPYQQQQWPGQYPPPQPQWGAPPPQYPAQPGYPQQPGYPPQYQYPPQQQPMQPWTGHPPPQHQAWPDPAPAWTQQPPAPQAAPPVSPPPEPAPPASAPASPAPQAVSQQAPTEQIPPAGQVSPPPVPQEPAPPPEKPGE